MNEIEQIKQDIRKLTERLDQLSSSSSIPREVQTAFTERLDFGTVEAGSPSAAGTGSVFIAGTPTLITLPPFPSQKVPVTFADGTTYNFYAE